MNLARFLLLVGVLTVGCRDKAESDSGLGYNEGPSISHTPVSGAVTEGALTLTATASDPDGVAEVVVYQRPIGVSFWDLVPMEQEDGTWTGSLDVSAPGFEYYLRATDRFGAEGYLPAEAERGPWMVTVQPEAKALPFSEDFELDPGETSLYSLGWTTVSEGFAAYVWQLSTSRAESGAQSVFHGRGAVDADTMRDWLISPPLDFSEMSQIQVTWRESGASTSAMGSHGLYISTIGADPSIEGNFVPVQASLPAPTESGFIRSAVIDLSDYAGERLVWLAWLYEGDYGDDWYIDDVRVETLSADLSATYTGQAPEPVFPGETVTVDWHIVNGSAASAAGYEATLSLPDGGGTVTTPTQALPDLEGYASTDLSWDIVLDPDVPSDRYRSMELTITNGGNTWTFEDRFLIGYLSTATLDITVDEPAITSIVLGVGDPDSPDTSFSVFSDFLPGGTTSVVSDLTPYADLLPPTAGPGRWFARVQTDRGGSVDSFAMSVSGITYGGAASGGPLVSNQPAWFFVPRPPAPELVAATPSVAAPGDIDLPLTLQLVNAGAATQGPVTGTLVALSSDATVVGGSALSIDPDIWNAGEAVVLTGPTLSIDATHTNSEPVQLSLSLTDGLEQWTVPVAVAVPWPVLQVIGTTIDDSGRDGILDDGESATIEFLVANVGDAGTQDRMQVTASISPTSVAQATFADDVDRLTDLVPDASGDMKFDIVGVSGSAGEALVFDLSYDDGVYVYTGTASVTLGEPPWTTFSAANDAPDDTEGPSGTFDFVNGRYRVYNDNIEVILTSSVPYDPATLYIEAWGSTTGSPYLFYRWIVNAGTGDFQGYVSGTGWQTVGTVAVDYLSTTEVQMTWAVGDLDTITSNLSIGFGTTWCGPPSYYCDHFPDGWGYGYDDTFNPYVWFDLDW